MYKGKKVDVFVTRASFMESVDVWRATTGIRKFHGCVCWGNARYSKDYSYVGSDPMTAAECRKTFGFVPRPGTAYLVEYNAKGKMKKSKVDIDFSN